MKGFSEQDLKKKTFAAQRCDFQSAFQRGGAGRGGAVGKQVKDKLLSNWYNKTRVWRFGSRHADGVFKPGSGLRSWTSGL